MLLSKSLFCSALLLTLSASACIYSNIAAATTTTTTSAFLIPASSSSSSSSSFLKQTKIKPTISSSKLNNNNKLSKLFAVKDVKAREILDSRGNPTVEVDVITENGIFTSSVPSGASTGAYEACELRDGGSRYMGKGVLQAVNNVNTIIKEKILGADEKQQGEVDQMMIDLDGTENKTKLGANAILGVSLALMKAGAASKGIPLYEHLRQLSGTQELILPVPSFNVINGGAHAGNKLAFQEFMLMPTGAETFSEAMQIGAECYHNLAKVIKSKYGVDATNVGDEGGFAPNIQSNKEGVELLMEALEKAAYTDKVVISMDVASSEFYEDGKYDLYSKDPSNKGTMAMNGEELGQFYKELANEFPIVSIEDPFDQDDWESYMKLTPGVTKNLQIVGDDLTVTNPKKIQEASDKEAANALLLKVNQIGSITESINAVNLAKSKGWGIMTSHRSGETEDNYIADIAVGLATGQIKTGAPCRSERLAKYNRILRIEDEFGLGKLKYAGKGFRGPFA